MMGTGESKKYKPVGNKIPIWGLGGVSGEFLATSSPAEGER
jgi:hypothetical protein